MVGDQMILKRSYILSLDAGRSNPGPGYLVSFNRSGTIYDSPGPTTSTQGSGGITGDTGQIQRVRRGVPLSRRFRVPLLRDSVHMVCREDRNEAVLGLGVPTHCSCLQVPPTL